VVSAATCRLVLAVMATAGLETSGDWLCDVGLPGKSGIGGGILTVARAGGLGGLTAARRRRQQRPRSAHGPDVVAHARPDLLATGADA
jgi:hypothetical protein